MEVRYCTPMSPMPREQAKLFYWLHDGAKEVQPFFNLVQYECPNCGHNFLAPKREADDGKEANR